MGILSGTSFLDAMVHGAILDKKENPRPENLEFRGFAGSTIVYPGDEGLYAVWQTPDGQWWRTNHFSGAHYKIECPDPASLHEPKEVTRCIMHNYHLIEFLPEDCRDQAWFDGDGNILSVEDMLHQGYHYRRRTLCRAIVDLHKADNSLEWYGRMEGRFAKPGQLQQMEAEYTSSLEEFGKALEALRADKYSADVDLSMPEKITREDLQRLATRVREGGIPSNPNHRPWEWPGHYPCDAIIRGHCPQCGEWCLTIRLEGVEVNGFAPSDGWRGLKKGERFRRDCRHVTVDSNCPVARPWQPAGLDHIRSYQWYEKAGAPWITKEQTPANATFWTEYDLLPSGSASKWVPDEVPPLCKYCEWYRQWEGAGLI